MSTGQPLVLVVEDDRAIRRLLRTALEAEGYRVVEAVSGEEGLRTAAGQPPDLVVLDLGLPDVDGQQVLERLREWCTAPVVILSARDRETQKIRALDHGADDYVTKPFGVGELLARLRTALRHARRTEPDFARFAVGDLRIDLAARSVLRRGERVHLTPREFDLLAVLVAHAGKVLTHRFLLRAVWGPLETEEYHHLRVHVANLRRKIEDDSARPRYILTEQGVGYRFAEVEVESPREASDA